MEQNSRSSASPSSGVESDASATNNEATVDAQEALVGNEENVPPQQWPQGTPAQQNLLLNEEEAAAFARVATAGGATDGGGEASTAIGLLDGSDNDRRGEGATNELGRVVQPLRLAPLGEHETRASSDTTSSSSSNSSDNTYASIDDEYISIDEFMRRYSSFHGYDHPAGTIIRTALQMQSRLDYLTHGATTAPSAQVQVAASAADRETVPRRPTSLDLPSLSERVANRQDERAEAYRSSHESEQWARPASRTSRIREELTPPPTYDVAVGGAAPRQARGAAERARADRRARSHSPQDNPVCSGWSLPDHRQVRASEETEAALRDYELRTSRPSANLCETVAPSDFPNATEYVPPAIVRGQRPATPSSLHSSQHSPSQAESIRAGELPPSAAPHRVFSELIHPRLRRERHLREFTADLMAAVQRHAYHAGQVLADAIERSSHERSWREFEGTTAGQRFREKLVDAINEHRLCATSQYVFKWLGIAKGADLMCLASQLMTNSERLLLLDLDHLAYELNPLHYQPRDGSEPWLHGRPSWGQQPERSTFPPRPVSHCRGCGRRRDFL